MHKKRRETWPRVERPEAVLRRRGPENGAHPRWLWDGGYPVGDKENIPCTMTLLINPGLYNHMDNIVSLSDLQSVAVPLQNLLDATSDAVFFALDIGKGASHGLPYLQYDPRPTYCFRQAWVQGVRHPQQRHINMRAYINAHILQARVYL